jgi:hypothetical protein
VKKKVSSTMEPASYLPNLDPGPRNRPPCGVHQSAADIDDLSKSTWRALADNGQVVVDVLVVHVQGVERPGALYRGHGGVRTLAVNVGARGWVMHVVTRAEGHGFRREREV